MGSLGLWENVILTKSNTYHRCPMVCEKGLPEAKVLAPNHGIVGPHTYQTLMMQTHCMN